MQKRGTLIADDHPIIREALTRCLEPEFPVHGTASDGLVLLQLVEQHQPCSLVLEIGLPGLNGFEVARRTMSMVPDLKILFFSQHHQPGYVQEAFEAGCSAYVCKTSPVDEVPKAMRAALRGMQYISVPGISSATIFNNRKDRLKSSLFRGLTLRQREVLQSLAEGNSAKMVAAKLNISARTVEFHKASILAALNIRSTAALIRYAVESGIVGTPRYHPGRSDTAVEADASAKTDVAPRLTGPLE